MSQRKLQTNMIFSLYHISTHYSVATESLLFLRRHIVHTYEMVVYGDIYIACMVFVVAITATYLHRYLLYPRRCIYEHVSSKMPNQ